MEGTILTIGFRQSSVECGGPYAQDDATDNHLKKTEQQLVRRTWIMFAIAVPTKETSGKHNQVC